MVFEFRSMRKVYAHSGFKLARFGPLGVRALVGKRALTPFCLGGGAGNVLVALHQPLGELIRTADVLSVDKYLRVRDL
jgi:hypothetical protein